MTWANQCPILVAPASAASSAARSAAKLLHLQSILFEMKNTGESSGMRMMRNSGSKMRLREICLGCDSAGSGVYTLLR